jgi:hypothetical protein
MFAVADKWTWSLVAVVALVALYAAVRQWVRRGAARNNVIRAQLNSASLSPRPQHYTFAHAALRALAFEDPERLVIALAAPEAERFLEEIWRAVGKDVAASGEEVAEVPPDGIEAIPARVAGRPAALVRMPPPEATTEAFFAAIVLNHELDEPAKPAPAPEVFYFTLERGFTLDNSPRTIFCQWDAEGHKNFGDGPPADPRKFLDHIVKHLSSASPPSPQASFQPGKGPTRGPSAN